jgi:clan AA aspartic protease (TIGR02281 family)
MVSTTAYFKLFFGLTILTVVIGYCFFGTITNPTSNVSAKTAPRAKRIYSTTARGNVTRVVISGNQVFVPVILGRGNKTMKASLNLDTGAEITIISPDVAKRLNIDMQSEPTEVFEGISGKTTGHVTKLRQVSVGPHTYSGLEVAVLPDYADGDGLLGMDFLRRFKYKIDFERQVIEWD